MVRLQKRQIKRYSDIIESLNTLLKHAIRFVIRLSVLVIAVKYLIGTVI